jgi:tetratricopeptide (TPR) repeat protein
MGHKRVRTSSLRWIGSCSGIFAVLSALLLTTAREAAAQTPSAVAPPPDAAPPPGYREAIEQALSEYEAHDYAEARAAFLRAHALYPNARTLRGLGMMEFELRNYIESVSLLEQALASQVKPLDAALRAQTEATLVRARGYVSSYDLQLNPAPPSVRVLIDGVPVAFTPGKPLTLTVGEHSLQVLADGYRDEQRSLSVKSGEQQSLAVELHALQQAPAAAVALGKPEHESTSGSWLGPALTIGGGAIAIAGFTIGAVALGKAKHADTQDDADGARALALGADISIGVGLATAAVGSYFWFFDSDEQPSVDHAGLQQLRIAVQPHGASVQAGLRF